MAEYMVKALQAPVWLEQDHPFVPDSKIRIEKVADYGNIISTEEQPDDPADAEPGVIYGVEERDVKRLQYYDALYDEEQTAALKEKLAIGSEELSPDAEEGVEEPGPPDAAPDMSEASAEDLADYINEKRLTVNETIELAGNDPATASKILDAENLATDNEPRAGVQRGLEQIIARASQ